MSTEDIIEKANKVLTIANWGAWVVSLIFFIKCGDWFGDRWYHWIFAFLLAGLLQKILAVVAKSVVMVAFGLSESGNNEENG